jgi:thermostable 8-oxoguanine DNA glycosylase
MPAEIGLAAFSRLRDERLLYAGVSPVQLEAALSRPFSVGDRKVRYRFPRQKARYLADCLWLLGRKDLTSSGKGRVLRDALIELPGVGPKTASWIARNWLDADDIAILDVHILRAMRLLSLVGEATLPRDYSRVEAIFVEFANALGVRASVLDAVMWQHMRRWGYLAGPRLAN